MRVLCLGMDGADHGLVGELLEQGRLPTLAGIIRSGAYGPLRSTMPAVTPTAWSTFLTGLNPARHGIFNFSTNPNRGAVAGRERRAAARGRRSGALLGAAGIRSAFVGGAVHLPGRGDRRDRRHRATAGRRAPQIMPASAARADPRRTPASSPPTTRCASAGGRTSTATPAR